MPTYLYEFIHDDGSDGAQFEVRQKMSDAPLTVHPISKQPIRRVITAPHVGGKNSESAVKANISDKRAEQLGFTKYVKAGDGTYEKRAGSGPDVIESK